jgi:WD40 repeat protein
MIPEHRLAVLLHQIKQGRIANCIYHNTTASPSLYTDHICDRSEFPLHTILELDDHSDEVWVAKFSNDGTRLATGGRDGRVIVYDVPTFKLLQILTDNCNGIVYVAWSPDDSKLISCRYDSLARVWDVEV